MYSTYFEKLDIEIKIVKNLIIYKYIKLRIRNKFINQTIPRNYFKKFHFLKLYHFNKFQTEV